MATETLRLSEVSLCLGVSVSGFLLALAARTDFCRRLPPESWMVEHMFPTVGYRPHGIGIETPDAKYLWESDTNMGAFFKRDMVTGEVVDSIHLAEGSPFPHGMSVWRGYIYWTDDIGGRIAPVCRVKI